MMESWQSFTTTCSFTTPIKNNGGKFLPKIAPYLDLVMPLALLGMTSTYLEVVKAH